MRIIAIFKSTFLGAGAAAKEDIRLFEVVKKRDIQIRRLFNQDQMFGAKLISNLDNNWNLLLEECETSDSPAGIPYFSSRDLINQIERGYFVSALPRALISKQDNKRKSEGNREKAEKHQKKEESFVVKNPDQVQEAWKLTKEEENNFGKVFDYATLLQRPNHSSGCKLCHKWAMKGYCFKDCNNKGSHVSWTIKEKSQFDKFARDARQE